MTRWEKLCSKWFSKYFKAKYLPEGLFEIDETPGIHCSVIVEPIHFLLLRSVQARQRNEFFIVGNNISTLPHYIQYGEPFTKREENTQETGQYWLITWLSALLLSIITILLRVVCSLHKRFSTSKTLWWGRNIWADNKMLKTSLNFYINGKKLNDMVHLQLRG